MKSLLLTNLLAVAAQVEPSGTPVWVPVFIVILMLLLFWWGLSRHAIPTATAVPNSHGHEEEHGDDHHAATAAPEAETAVADDLKKIEGIGPKIETILNDAGIYTFAQLAAADVTHLEKIVREDAGITVAYPDTWPEQAGLARDEQWEALETLQEELKGGRRA